MALYFVFLVQLFLAPVERQSFLKQNENIEIILFWRPAKCVLDKIWIIIIYSLFHEYVKFLGNSGFVMFTEKLKKHFLARSRARSSSMGLKLEYSGWYVRVYVFS